MYKTEGKRPFGKPGIHEDNTKMDIVFCDVMPCNLIGSSKTLLYIFTKLHSVTSQKTVIFTVTAIISHLTILKCTSRN
jgi:hypothetical protein